MDRYIGNKIFQGANSHRGGRHAFDSGMDPLVIRDAVDLHGHETSISL